MARYDTWRDRLFMVFVYAVLIVVAIVMLYPFWEQLMLSLSTREDALRGGFRWLPNPLVLDAFQDVLDSPEIWGAFRNTLFRVVVGTAWGVFVTALIAYPLARDDFPLRRLWMTLIVFTMLFSGGLIPNYLLRKSLGLINNPLVLILPGLFGFNIIIMRNFFRAIPYELTEAARLDGATDWQIWWRIVLPLSKPVLATMTLFLAVYHWNAYFDALIYITDRDLYVLQVILRRVLLEGQADLYVPGTAMDTARKPTAESVKAALVMVTVIPIVLIYPFLQRYFIKGTLLGAVKG